MRCETFDRWLNEGRPQEGAAESQAYARTCARCGAALEAALGLETWLAALVARAPEGFADRVMARIAFADAATEPARVEVVDAEPALPWWVEMITEPVAALALLVAALLAAMAPAWVTRGPAAFASLGAWLSSLIDGFALQVGAALNPTLTDALVLALLPPILLLSLPLYQLAQRLVLVRSSAPAHLSTAP